MLLGNLLKPLKVAFISTYPPRRCGIATYTADLTESFRKLYRESRPEGAKSCFEVIALNNTAQGYPYSSEVSFHISDQHREDYRRAADFINLSSVDVICLQHEFGIFGGEDGSYIISLLEELKKPVVTTFHTILAEPSAGQKKTLSRICELSTLVVVQAQMAVRLLKKVYGIPETKILMIPHGAPDVPLLEPALHKKQFQAEGRILLFTFGLLGPNKGIEYAIAAMEKVAKRYPQVLYLVLGATHPEVKRRHGEQYRQGLEKLVREKGLEDQITFHNRYVSLERLIDFLLAADIYLTPYVNKDQITSGTLAYALACGKVIVSTPYWYAQELLAQGRGCLVPFCDSEAMADKLLALLDDEAQRDRMRRLSYQYGRKMIWREVAGNYAAAFEKARLDYSKVAQKSMEVLAVTESAILPEIRLDHLFALTDDTGLFQHAFYTVPNRSEGYCTDDNARALIVAAMNWRLFKDEAVLPLFHTYLSFLLDGYEEEKGRMRNFLSYRRCWLEDAGSEDSQGRTIWALGYAVAHPPDESLLGLMIPFFKQLLSAAPSFTSPRAWTFTILGLHYYLKRFGGDPEMRRLLRTLSGRLGRQFHREATESWFWPEEIVAYDNARIPQALIAAGSYLREESDLQTGLKALNWLITLQTSPEGGQFSPVGNDGWYRRGGKKATFDQQPLEAAAMVEACHQAYLATGEYRWQIAMDWSFNWFFGNNDLHQALYDFSRGGCHDGLTPGGVNLNQGGESTLSLLMALHRMHLASHRGYAGVGEIARTASPHYNKT